MNLPLAVNLFEVFPDQDGDSIREELLSLLELNTHLDFYCPERIVSWSEPITEEKLGRIRDWKVQDKRSMPSFQVKILDETKPAKTTFRPYLRDTIFKLVLNSNTALHQDAIHIILVYNKNELNWFSDFDPRVNTGFVQVTDWEEYVPGNPVYPVAFEVLSLILNLTVFRGNNHLADIHHEQPVGCINDHSPCKKDVIIKLRGADICDSCMAHFERSKANPVLLRSVFKSIQQIRSAMFDNKDFLNERELDLVVCGRELIFPGLGLTIRLDPAEYVLYKLLLKEESGINRSHLASYKNDIYEAYSDLVSLQKKQIRKTVDLLCDYRDNSFNEKISRLNRKIRNALLDYAGPFTALKNGEAYKLAVDRRRVTIR